MWRDLTQLELKIFRKLETKHVKLILKNSVVRASNQHLITTANFSASMS